MVALLRICLVWVRRVCWQRKHSSLSVGHVGTCENGHSASQEWRGCRGKRHQRLHVADSSSVYEMKRRDGAAIVRARGKSGLAEQRWKDSTAVDSQFAETAR